MTDVDAARRALEDALGPAEVLSDPLALKLYARDASMVEGGCALVAFPRSIGDIVACVTIAAAHGLPVVPRGSGTGLAGAATPIGDALVVVTAKMHEILEVRTDDRLAWVEPGLFNLDLSTALRPTGFFYAPDPSSQQTSSIGGNANTNAGGPHCLAYGVTSAHVLALDVVMPDGTVERLGSEGPEAPGYDLRGVVVGSEGTLGIVARVCVRLTPVPPSVRTMLLDFMDVGDCAATVSDIIARGVVPAAIEMMDHGIIVAAESFAHAGYPTDAAAILIVEVDGLPSGVEAQTREVEAAAHANRVRTIRVAADDAERALLWKGRKSAFGAVAQIAPHYHLHDCVVPRTKLVEVLTGVYAIAKHHDLIVTNVFHAGDGNLHPLLSFDRRVPGTLERVLEASDQIVRLCVDAGGALSGEHGIGLEKRDFMPLVFTAEDLAAQACVRDAFDPDHRMNPQKVLPAGARCGDFAMMRGSDAAEAAANLPEGSWISIHPHAKQDVEDAVQEAAAAHSRLLVIGGRTHMNRGNPIDADAELWTTMLDEVVAYEPAEMLAVVHAGMRVGDLQAVLAEGGQEWPVDAPHDATVGGVIATGVSSFRRLRLGHVRDTVVELELVRGDGLLVKSGARTVKNVTGYDLHRLATGSLGTLGVIVQVALKLRPVPQVRRMLTLEGDGLALGRGLLETVPLPSAVIAEPGRARVWLEGWADEVEEQTLAARTIDPALAVAQQPAPFDPMAIEGATVVEAAVVPSRIEALVAGRDDWTALLGVGLVWFGLPGGAEPLDELRVRVAEAAGVAPVIRGVGGLGDGPIAAPTIHRRLKESFDPAGIMAPGRFWGGI